MREMDTFQPSIEKTGKITKYHSSIRGNKIAKREYIDRGEEITEVVEKPRLKRRGLIGVIFSILVVFVSIADYYPIENIDMMKIDLILITAGSSLLPSLLPKKYQIYENGIGMKHSFLSGGAK